MTPANEAPPEALLTALRHADRILCVAHERPDGDAVGSVSALMLGLRALGKQITGALPDPVPEKYHFIPAAQELTLAPQGPFTLALMLDCDTIDRLGGLEEAVTQIPTRAVIDHHQTAVPHGPLDYLDPHAAATGVIVLRLLDALGVTLTADIATCLYLAVATDTGFFRFQNTNADALTVAARCVAAGADAYALAQRTTDRVPLAHKRLLGRALSNLRLCCEGRVALAHVGPEDFASSDAHEEHTDGLIDALKDIEGVELSLFLKSNHEAVWQVSLRSTQVDVAAIARSFGGGGHAAAAGCEMTGSRTEVEQKLLQASAAALPRQVSLVS